MVREVVTLLVLSKGQIHHSRGLDRDVLKLNRSSYYKWKKTAFTRKKRLLNDAILGARVKTVFTTHSGCYGAKRIAAELKDQIGYDPVNHKRVARVMRELKLFGYDRRNARSPPLFRTKPRQCSRILSAGSSPLRSRTSSTSGTSPTYRSLMGRICT